MSKFNKKEEQEPKEIYQFPVYTNQELRDLDKIFAEKYNGGHTRVDIENWMKDEGALSKDGSVILTGWGYKKNFKEGYSYPVCDYPSKYALLENMNEQLSALYRKREYAIKMNTKANDELLKEKVELTSNMSV